MIADTSMMNTTPRRGWFRSRLGRIFRRDPGVTCVPRTLERKTEWLYSDDPVSLSKDSLNRKRLASQLARTIQDLASETESAVVGLVGPWGSGKTSLLSQIQEVLEKESKESWYIGRHNPWAYADFAGAAAGFFASLRDAVPEDVLGREWREVVGEWVSKAAPIGAVGGIAGIDGSGAIGAVGAVITGDRSPARLRQAAAEGLKKIDCPVLMVLDDLDRLAPEELLYTFKLVRFLGRLPNVYYLLAYDEATLTDLLEATDLLGEGTGRAQQYLEKIIQVRLEIPPMLPEQQAGLASVALDEICLRRGITLTADTNHRLRRMWQDCLSVYLNQPRSVKRLFTQVDATWPEVADEVDFADFVAITFLRVFERRTLDLIVRHRDELLRQDYSLVLTRDKESLPERRERWKGLIDDARPRLPEAIEALLAHLFIHIRSARNNMTYEDSSYQESIAQRMGVGSPDYFDRYIQVGVPESDLQDAAVRAAADELRSGESGAAVAELARHMSEDVLPALRKLRREHLASPLPASTTLPLLSSVYLPAMDQKHGPLGFSADSDVIQLTMQVLDLSEISAAVNSVVEMADSGPGGLELAASAVRRALKSSDSPPRWATATTAPVTTALNNGIRASARQPARSQAHLASHLHHLLGLAGPVETRKLLWEHIDSGAWDLRELLGLLVPLWHSTNGEETWTSMGDFPESTVEELLGVDKVLAQIPEQPDLLRRHDPDGYFDRRVDPNDLDARIDYALTSLERVRARRRQDNQTTNAE